MVESSPQQMSNYPRLGEPLELQSFFKWNEYTEEVVECDEEKV